MASKNIFSEGYTQFPVLGSAPVSVSWLTGQAEVVAPGPVERGIEEMTRFVPRSPFGCCDGGRVWGIAVVVMLVAAEGVVIVGEEEELRKGMRQPQPEGGEVGFESEEVGGCCCDDDWGGMAACCCCCAALA